MKGKEVKQAVEQTELALGELESSVGSQANPEEGEANQGLPEGWGLSTLDILADRLHQGINTSADKVKYVSKGMKILQAKHITSGVVNYAGAKELGDGDIEKYSGRFKPLKNHILFTNIGTIGRSIVLKEDADYLIAWNIFLISVSTSINPQLLKQYLDLLRLSGFYESLYRGGATQFINKKQLSALEIPLPPLAEQTVIAQTLDTLLTQVDNIKTRLDAIPNILKTFRQSVLAAAVSGKLTEEWRGENECEQINLDAVKSFWVSQYQAQGKKMPKAKYVESHKLGIIPSSWVNTKIGEVFDVYVGATPSRANKKYWGGNIPWVSSSEVAFCKIRSVKEFITQDGLDNTSTNLHPIGTVMMAMIGQGKTRGQAAILKLEACHNQNTAAMRVPQGFALSEYLYFFLFKQYEETRRAGGGNNQQALNKSSVQSLAFPLPPLKEQTQIVRRVEELFAFADQIEQQVKNAQGRVNNLMQSILAKAFRGELTAQWRAENPALISGENSAEALLTKIQEEREKLKPKKVAKKKAVRKQGVK